VEVEVRVEEVEIEKETSLVFTCCPCRMATTFFNYTINKKILVYEFPNESFRLISRVGWSVVWEVLIAA